MSEIPQRLIDKAFRIHDKIDGVRDEATYIAVIAQALDEERRDWFDSMSALSSFFGCGLGEDYHTAQQMYDRVMWGVNFRDERTTEMLDKLRSEIRQSRAAMECALGYLTGNMDGDMGYDADPIELLRQALAHPSSPKPVEMEKAG